MGGRTDKSWDLFEDTSPIGHPRLHWSLGGRLLLIAETRPGPGRQGSLPGPWTDPGLHRYETGSGEVQAVGSSFISLGMNQAPAIPMTTTKGLSW